MNSRIELAFITTLFSLTVSCGGKYMIKSYPADAKLYIKDIRTSEKKLIGTTPTQINENPKLGDIFFFVLERENYQPKEIMVKVNEGESFTISAKLDPLLPADSSNDNENKNAKNDDNKPQPGSPQKKEEPKDWEVELDDIKLRIALLETTTAFTKDALFSPRMMGGVPSYDRDRRESVISLIFQAQSAIQVGKLDKANEHIDQALQMDEYSTNAWLLKGSVKYLQKDYASARGAWERTLKLDPYNKTAFNYLNNVYKKLSEKPLKPNPNELRVPASIIDIENRSRPRENKNNSRNSKQISSNKKP